MSGGYHIHGPHELGFDLIPDPLYSPDLVPCNFLPFPDSKGWLGGKRFSSNEGVIDAVNAYYADLEKSYFSEGMQKLESRWTNCVALE